MSYQTPAGFNDGQESWPGVTLSPEAFAAHCAAVGAGASAHFADLYLACACALGSTGALAALETEMFPVVRAALGAMRLPEVVRDEVIQELRVKLFIAHDGGTAKIAEYSGTGPLRAWLRIAAVRTALNHRRRHRRESSVEERELAATASIGDSPELAQFKSSCRGEFQACLESAFRALSPAERNLLRQHHLDGLRLIELAELHRVHRVTIARRLQDARDALRRHVAERLRQRLAVTEGDVDSMFRALRTQLDVSLARLLQTEA